MLVLHANWSGQTLKLWAESLEACLGAASAGDPVSTAPVTGPATGPASGTGDAPGGAVVLAEPDAAVAHAFAVQADGIRAALLDLDGVVAEHLPAPNGASTFRVHLPATPPGAEQPLPSDRLGSIIGAGERRADPVLGAFDVPCLSVPGDRAIPILLGIEDHGPAPALEFGHALRYWMAVARFVLELLADQRFIPTLIQSRGADLKAAWQPWLHDAWAGARVGAMLTSMPPIVRAVVDAHTGQPWPMLAEALTTMTDATVRRALTDHDFADAIEGRDSIADPQVAWLEGLLSEVSEVAPPADSATEMLRDVGRWIAELDDAGQDRPLRLCFVLSEPDDTVLPDDMLVPSDEVRWRLSLHLMSAGENPVIIDAEEIWRDPTAVQRAGVGSVRHPEELLLAELGRAARIYPVLERALATAEPAGLDLGTVEATAFLREYRELLEESGFTVMAPEWWGKPVAQIGARLHLDAPELETALAAGPGNTAAGESLLGLSSLVNYRWQLAVGDRPLSMDEFKSLAKAARTGALVRLHGAWVELQPEKLGEAARFFESRPGGEMTLLEAIQLAYDAGGTQFGLPIFGLDAAGWVADLLGASSGQGAMPRLVQPEQFVGKLRPYQEVGLSWLAFLDQFGLGACLADDMGLGKTIQLIALLLAERERAGDAGADRLGPTLLIVPTSVVSNWSRELKRFAPNLTVHVQHGPDRPVGDPLLALVEAIDVVITTYTLVSRDRESLSRVQWRRVVLDEAQYIKNPPTKQTATIRALKTTRRIALTGTPVENRLSELWSIMEFCNPGYLGQPGEFRRRFSIPVERHRDQRRAEKLRALVRPFVLRRLKTDPTVINDLPPCVVTKEYATLTSEQAALYERTVNEMLGQVGRAEGIQRRGLVLATLVRLKQICNHPAQFAEARASREKGSHPKRASAELLSNRSGKTGRMMEMLEELLATDNKALIFTQFRRMGHMLASMIQHDLDTEIMFLHGGTPAHRRQEMIDRFQDPEGGVPVFILSLKAGGLGVNLTAANHVFHFDRWWNPAVENQATDRAFRIGQTRTVHVHKFVCLGTLEERIDQMIEQKTELAKNIIGAGEDWLTDLSTPRLRELLMLRYSGMEEDS